MAHGSFDEWLGGFTQWLTATAWPRDGALPTARVPLFLNDAGAKQFIDLPLESGPAIVVQVNGAGQLNEPGPKVLGLLAHADCVLHFPEFPIDYFELGCELGELLGWGNFPLA